MDYEKEFCRCCGFRGRIVIHELLQVDDLNAEELTLLACENCGHEWEITNGIPFHPENESQETNIASITYCPTCGESNASCHCIDLLNHFWSWDWTNE